MTNGKLHMQGKFTYDGSFRNNVFDGRGSCIFPGNGKYEGTFREGLREGRGTYTFENGSVYEGRFRHDNIDGIGTLEMDQDKSICIADQTWFLPVQCQSDMRFVHRAAGFGTDGV